MLLHRIHTRAVPYPDLLGLADEIIRIFPEEFQLGLELAGLPFIIRIQERDPLALRLFDPQIPGGGGATVRLEKKANG